MWQFLLENIFNAWCPSRMNISAAWCLKWQRRTLYLFFFPSLEWLKFVGVYLRILLHAWKMQLNLFWFPIFNVLDRYLVNEYNSPSFYFCSETFRALSVYKAMFISIALVVAKPNREIVICCHLKHGLQKLYFTMLMALFWCPRHFNCEPGEIIICTK